MINATSYTLEGQVRYRLCDIEDYEASRTRSSPPRCFDLDFHAVPYHGEDPIIERHYVSKRSRRQRTAGSTLP